MTKNEREASNAKEYRFEVMPAGNGERYRAVANLEHPGDRVELIPETED